ncbi:hypothetical protein FO519_009621 [Halicephalobus sp. NKZ332]|nr:hypothetical protein FO519_009621 [Halicephalobus sp. NKZ332]
MPRSRFRLVIIIFIIFIYMFFPIDNPKFKTPYGEVEGFYYNTDNGKRTQVFLGVPFAQAERFEKPKPYPKWSGIRPAKEFSKGCVPIHLSLGTDISEDCLYINVIKPEEDPETLLGYPVLVFIHGGGFIGGSSNKYGYESFADHFASERILVISVQYRTGFLGFLSTGEENLPGNLGLWDLAFALRFIRNLLPELNGDPDYITVFGQSAGSAAAHALSISPHTSGNF